MKTKAKWALKTAACTALAWSLSSMPCLANVASPEATLVVEQFSVSGNSLLSAHQIDMVLQPFKGTQDIAGLKRAANALQEQYRQAGFGAVVVYLPPQDGSAVIKLAVLEGRLREVQISGATHFSEANIRASLPTLLLGQTPLVRQIDAEIQMANENPAKQVQVLLQPGAQPGDVNAKVTVIERPLQRWSLRADNTGNARTGLGRASLSWQHADLTGADDVLSLMYLTAPQHPADVKVLSAGYRRPIYAQQAALDAYLALSDMDGGTAPTPAGALAFSGKGQVAGVKLTRYLPRLGEVDHRAVGGLEYRHYDNQCAIAGLPSGACGTAGASVATSVLSLSYSLQTGGDNAMGASVNWLHNLGLDQGRGSAEAFDESRPGADVHYSLLRFNAFATRTLPQAWAAQFRLAGQWTADALIPGEQFGVGGAGSVRGYQERELSGDLGASATMELISPEISSLFHLSDTRLRFVAFADAGWIANRMDTPCENSRRECTLESAGFGVRLGRGQWEWSIDYARVLRPSALTARDRERLHVTLTVAL